MMESALTKVGYSQEALAAQGMATQCSRKTCRFSIPFGCGETKDLNMTKRLNMMVKDNVKTPKKHKRLVEHG